MTSSPTRARAVRQLLAAVALGLGTAAALAQSEDNPADAPAQVGASAESLGLPTDLTVFGDADPAVRRATAIVNGTIITDTDVDQRLALVIAANGGRLPPEERDRLRLQILRNLIDETLQIQEAKGNDITVSQTEIDDAFNRVATNFKQKPDDFTNYLKEKGSSAASMKRQIQGELAWRRLLGRRVEPFVAVGDDEVKAIMGRLNAAKGAAEYHIGEIFLAAAPENAGATQANADRIVDQLRNGASFVAYARQYSQASTAAVGGDLGWVRAEQLPDALAQVAQTMPTGSISQPIAVPGGYSVIALLDKRQVLTADARDAVLALKQVSLAFPPGTTRGQAGPRVEAFGNAMKALQGCGTVDAVAKTLGADVVDNDAVTVRDLPPALQPIMLALQVGQASQPFGSLNEGVRSLVLCGRDEPEAANAPSYDKIYAQLQDERVNRRAQRYLRDLRRDAVIDYR